MKSNLNKIITKGYPLTKNRNILGAWQNKAPPSSGREGGPQKHSAQQSRRAQVRTNFSSSTDTSQGNTINY